jgi:uncharacterized protein
VNAAPTAPHTTTPLKFQPDTLEGVNAISRHESGGIWVRANRYSGGVLVPWRGAVQAWPVESFDALAAHHFDALLALDPELVVFGSGTRLRFVAPALLRALIERRIGVETMDTAAACRTYNVLASEGRSVVAALLQEPVAP